MLGEARAAPERNCTSVCAGPMKTDVTSEAALWVATILLDMVANSALSLGSIVTNTINICVFSSMRAGDGRVTQNYIILSVADGLFGLLRLLISIATILHRQNQWPDGFLSPLHFFMLGRIACTIPLTLSVATTAVLAVVRCCSVYIPFKFRSVITGRRQLLAILLLILPYVAVMAYRVSSYRLVRRLDPRTNSSLIMLKDSDSSSRRLLIPDVYRSVLLHSCFAVVLVSLVLMVLTLYRSIKFKKLSAPGSSSSSGREAQVMKTVLLVSAIFVICNLPGTIVPILRHALPGFNDTGYLRRTFYMSIQIHDTCSILNATLNIFVFYSFNTQYKKVLGQLFF